MEQEGLPIWIRGIERQAPAGVVAEGRRDRLVQLGLEPIHDRGLARLLQPGNASLLLLSAPAFFQLFVAAEAEEAPLDGYVDIF